MSFLILAFFSEGDFVLEIPFQSETATKKVRDTFYPQQTSLWRSLTSLDDVLNRMAKRNYRLDYLFATLSMCTYRIEESSSPPHCITLNIKRDCDGFTSGKNVYSREKKTAIYFFFFFLCISITRAVSDRKARNRLTLSLEKRIVQYVRTCPPSKSKLKGKIKAKS